MSWSCTAAEQVDMQVLRSPETKHAAGLGWERGLEPESDIRHVGAELPEKQLEFRGVPRSLDALQAR